MHIDLEFVYFRHCFLFKYLALIQVAKYFVPVQIFWVSPKILLHLVPLQKLCGGKKNYWMQIILLSGTKCLWLAQYVNKFLVRHKMFGPAQNILRDVKGHRQQVKLQLLTWQCPFINYLAFTYSINTMEINIFILNEWSTLFQNFNDSLHM